MLFLSHVMTFHLETEQKVHETKVYLQTMTDKEKISRYFWKWCLSRFLYVFIDHILSRKNPLYVTYCCFLSFWPLCNYFHLPITLNDSVDMLKLVPVKRHSWKREHGFYLFIENLSSDTGTLWIVCQFLQWMVVWSASFLK